ncbi:hypothetical protein ACWGII_21905 [Streptomyces sp. NPDC054855]
MDFQPSDTVLAGAEYVAEIGCYLLTSVRRTCRRTIPFPCPLKAFWHLGSASGSGRNEPDPSFCRRRDHVIARKIVDADRSQSKDYDIAIILKLVAGLPSEIWTLAIHSECADVAVGPCVTSGNFAVPNEEMESAGVNGMLEDRCISTTGGTNKFLIPLRSSSRVLENGT